MWPDFIGDYYSNISIDDTCMTVNVGLCDTVCSCPTIAPH